MLNFYLGSFLVEPLNIRKWFQLNNAPSRTCPLPKCWGIWVKLRRIWRLYCWSLLSCSVSGRLCVIWTFNQLRQFISTFHFATNRLGSYAWEFLSDPGWLELLGGWRNEGSEWWRFSGRIVWTLVARRCSIVEWYRVSLICFLCRYCSFLFCFLYIKVTKLRSSMISKQ